MRRRFRLTDPNPFAGFILAAAMTAVGVLAIVVVLMLPGCAGFNAIAGASLDINNDKAVGRNPIAEFGIEGNFKRCERCYGFYRHNSAIFDGEPFNNHPEQPSDRIGFEYRLPLWRAK